MTTKSIRKRKIIIFLFPFLFILIIFWVVYSPLTKPTNTMKEEDHLIGDGFYFNVYTKDTKTEKKDGIFENVNNETVFYASIQNSGKDRKAQIKAYLDYEEIPIQINNSLNKNHNIFLKDGENIAIPFTIPKGLEDGENHKFLISLLVGTDTHESIVKHETTNYAISFDYFIKNSKSPIAEQIKNDYKKIKSVDATYSGLVINNDLNSNEKRVKLPPSEIIKSPNEPFKLAVRLGNLENHEKFLLLVTIDWFQTDINNKRYLLLEVEPNKLGYEEIELVAPEKKGLYEIGALVIPNPENANTFTPLENSYRFTLKVE